MKENYGLTNTKYILTLLIVCMHCHNYSKYMQNGVSDIYIVMENAMFVLCDSAVPGFFAISSYLFFRSYSTENYPNKLISRMKSLLVPFLIFSLLGAISFYLIDFFKNGFHSVSIPVFINEVLNQKHNGPIWYMKTLFLFVLCAPAIHSFIKRYDVKGVVIGCFFLYIINLFILRSYSSLLFWMPLILFSSYLGIRESEGKTIKISWWCGLFYIPLYFTTLVMWSGDFSGNGYYTYRLLSGILVVVLGQTLVWKPYGFERYMIFIFLTHILCRRLLFFIPYDESYTLLPVFSTILIGTFVAMVLKKFWPNFYKVISGGR